MNTTIKKRTIGQTVAEDYRTARIFGSFGLDFCCGGNKTIEEACAKKGVDVGEVQKALDNLGNAKADNHNYNDWSLDFLIDYIVNNHHEFVRSKLPEIEFYAHKVANVHGERHTELKKIYQLFMKLQNEITDHLDKEEQILFPYVKELVKAEKENISPQDQPQFGTAANPVAMMEAEHEEAGGIMEEIQNLSNDFTPPEDACATYRVLFQNLEGFRDDLHKHVHLENNILFPKALKLEKELVNSK